MNRTLICHSLLEEKPRTLVRGECHKDSESRKASVEKECAADSNNSEKRGS